jgi:dihydroorotate dehydrogenase (NAD+) catalytic subunit
MTELGVDIAGIGLKKPLILASGILDETGYTMLRVASAGAGAIVTKSIGLQERAGNPNPTVVELDTGLLNAMGLPNPGMEEFAGEIAKVKGNAGIPIIGSIFAGDEDGFAEMAALMEKAGADALELNLSCPHAKGYGAELGQVPDRVRSITASVKSASSIPVFIKLTPNTADIAELAASAEKGGADGVVAINTLRAMAISPELRRPVLASKIGGYSGPGIKPIGLRCVYEIYDAVHIPIVGVGGIATGKDAVEYMMAGASAFQVGTALCDGGMGAVERILGEMTAFMQKEGIERASELTGMAHGGR